MGRRLRYGQLWAIPEKRAILWANFCSKTPAQMVVGEGFEPPTLCV